MKELTIFILLFSVAHSSQAQDTTKRYSRLWSIGIMASPDYCFRIFRTDYDNFTSWRKGLDEVGLGLTAGILVRRDLNRRWQMESGIVFSRHRINTEVSMYDDKLQPIGSLRLFYDYHFLQIPLRMNYTLHKGPKWKSFVSSGIGLSYTVNALSTVNLTRGDGSEYRSREIFNDANFPLCILGQVGIGSEYKAAERLNLGVMILYRQHLTRVYYGTDINGWEYPYSIGLNLSCFYNL